MIKKKSYQSGFSLIELLIVMMIIGILVTISVFALVQARQSGRDAKRKTDLEQIKSGMEIYRADCNRYPATLPNPGNALNGDNSVSSCRNTNVYISSMPPDPQTGRTYSYTINATRTQYTLCASLEGGTGTAAGCGSCGSGVQCNYKVTGP